jgi:hypothetical protein
MASRLTSTVKTTPAVTRVHPDGHCSGTPGSIGGLHDTAQRLVDLSAPAVDGDARREVHVPRHPGAVRSRQDQAHGRRNQRRQALLLPRRRSPAEDNREPAHEGYELSVSGDHDTSACSTSVSGSPTLTNSCQSAPVRRFWKRRGGTLRRHDAPGSRLRGNSEAVPLDVRVFRGGAGTCRRRPVRTCVHRLSQHGRRLARSRPGNAAVTYS